MIIWLWILIALSLTLFLLRNKKIEPHNLMWAFLPIEKYGIEIMGMVLKPIYFFSIFLVAYYLMSGKFKLKLPLYSYITTFLFPVIISFTLLSRTADAAFKDFTFYFLFLFCICCAASSLSTLSKPDDLRQIQDVIICTAVGYGILFFVLVNLYNFGLDIPGVWSDSTSGASIMVNLNNVIDGEFISNVRLRGFFNDANSSAVVFLLGFAAVLERWIAGGGGVKYVLFSALFFSNIFYTSSRSGMLIFILVAVVYLFRFFFSKSMAKRKIILIGALLVTTLGLSLFLIFNSDVFDSIYASVMRSYSRSNVNDRFGRFSIWRESLNAVFGDNWFAGLGINRIIYVTGLGRDAHNTFIEVICSSGLFVGLYYIFYFIFPVIIAARYRLKNGHGTMYISHYIISFSTILLVNFTVSNIVSSYMIYMLYLIVLLPGIIDSSKPPSVSSEVPRRV